MILRSVKKLFFVHFTSKLHLAGKTYPPQLDPWPRFTSLRHLYPHIFKQTVPVSGYCLSICCCCCFNQQFWLKWHFLSVPVHYMQNTCIQSIVYWKNILCVRVFLYFHYSCFCLFVFWTPSKTRWYTSGVEGGGVLLINLKLLKYKQNILISLFAERWQPTSSKRLEYISYHCRHQHA